MKRIFLNNKFAITILEVSFVIIAIMLYFLNTGVKKTMLLASTFKHENSVVLEEHETARILTDEEILENFYQENSSVITFLANTFAIDENVLKENLSKDYESIDLLNTENIEYTLIEYLIDLEENNKELFDNTRVGCSDSKEYIVSLIKYFTQIYDDVDFAIASGIAQVESGYTASTMLKYNNIFGGMSSGGLIKYKNIEYGVLKYVRMLSTGYFSKGLTTVEAIGKVYNPIYTDAGVKIANPSWVQNVTKATENYTNYEKIEINSLIELKNN